MKAIAVVAEQFAESTTGGGGVYVNSVVREYRKHHPVIVFSIDVAKAPFERTLTTPLGRFKVHRASNLTVFRYEIAAKPRKTPFSRNRETEYRTLTRGARAIADLIQSQKSDILFAHLHGHFAMPGIIAPLLRSSTKLPVISTIHALESVIWEQANERGGTIDPLQIEKRRTLELMATASHVVTFPSPDARQHYVDLLAKHGVSFDARRVVVVPGGIRPEDLLSGPPQTRSHKPITLLALARLDPVKNLELIIKAFCQTQLADNPNYKLVIIGRPEDKEYVRLLTDAARSANNVTVTPRDPRDTKWGYYDRSSIFVLSSFSEPFGITLVEAGARWCSIVALDSAGSSFILEKSRGTRIPGGWVTPYGWVVDAQSDSAQNLARVLQHVIGLTDRQRNKSEQAMVKRIARQFVWPTIAKQFLDLSDSNLCRS